MSVHLRNICRCFLGACFAGTFLLSWGEKVRAQDPIPSQRTIRTEVNLVTARFTVHDSAGRLVNDLTKERFQFLENGMPREISFFEPPRNTRAEMDRLWVAFLVDVSGSTFATRSEEIIAAEAFLDNVHDFTQVGIFGFTDKLLSFQGFSPNRAAALRAFRSARPHLGQTAIYDSLAVLISKMADRVAGLDRKVIILISDAIDEAYNRAGRVIELARRSNVTVYTILVPSASQLYIGPARSGRKDGKAAEQRAKEEAFARLSGETGGRHFSGLETILGFDDTLALINDDIFGNLYSIGYYTDNPYLEKEERDMRVEIDYSGAQVSALFKRLPECSSAKKKVITALFEGEAISELPEDMEAHFHEIGAEIDLLMSGREGGQAGLPFRIKISPYSLRRTERGDVGTQIGVIGVLLDQKGREVVRLREFFRVTLSRKEIRKGRGVVYTNKLLPPPGAYDLKLALLEIGTWKVTVFEHSVRVE